MQVVEKEFVRMLSKSEMSINDDPSWIRTVNKVNIPTVATLSQTISNPPTQAQVTAIQNKLNELILALEP